MMKRSLEHRLSPWVQRGVRLAAALLTWPGALGMAQAATLTVGTGGKYATIQAAIDAAGPDDTVRIAAGTYPGAIRVSKKLTLAGAGPGVTILDGTGLSSSVVSVVTQLQWMPVVISGVTIRNGNAASDGGGVFNQGGWLTIRDSIISGNAAKRFGGGIHNIGSGKLAVQNSTITGNTAANGGAGIYSFYVNSTVTVSDSTISDNRGSGISSGSSLSVSNSTFSGNGGSGIDNFGSLSVSNSTFSGNDAAYGGGIRNQGGTVKVSNSTITGNKAASGGGGIFNQMNGKLSVGSSTITGNSSAEGGGIMNSFLIYDPTGASNQDYSKGTVSIGKSILANQSRGGNCNGAITDAGHNLISSDDPCGQNNGANGDIVIPGLALGPLQNNGGRTATIALPPGSPAIDAGGATCGLTNDQRGFARPSGGACDIGAFEVVPRLAGRITLDKVPTAWTRGQSQEVAVSIFNEGEEPWPQPVKLNAAFSGQNGVQETSQSPPFTLAPGQSMKIEFAVKGPAGKLSFSTIEFNAYFVQSVKLIPRTRATQAITLH